VYLYSAPSSTHLNTPLIRRSSMDGTRSQGISHGPDSGSLARRLCANRRPYHLIVACELNSLTFLQKHGNSLSSPIHCSRFISLLVFIIIILFYPVKTVSFYGSPVNVYGILYFFVFFFIKDI